MTTDSVMIEWRCPTCGFANDEEFTELPETVTCGSCGNTFDYDDANDLARPLPNNCAECARSFGPWFVGECEHV